MLKIGVLGAGHLGKIHLKILKESPSFELVGFYDSMKEVRDKVSAEFGLKSFDNADVLIDSCDVIDIVTPTITHFNLAKEAIKKSKHVFIEKPLANSIEEGKTLMRLSKEANVKVQVGHVERFNPAFIAAQPYLNSPLFIETHRLALFNPRGTDVSVVLDLMIHDIDIVLSTVKANIKKISASGVAVVSDTPDITNARIEFDNGCVANLTASRISMKNMRKSRFFQRDAYISVDFLEKRSEIIRMKTIEGIADPLAVTIDLGEKGIKQIYFENPEIKSSNAIQSELETFANAIDEDSEPIVSIDAGYKALEIAHLIIEKVAQGANFSKQSQ